jgi:hypothetical protein
MNPITRGLAGQGGDGQPAPSRPSSPSFSGSPGGGGGSGAPLPNERGFIEGLESRRGILPRSLPEPNPQPLPLCAFEQCGQHVEQAYFTIVEAAAPVIAAGASAWFGLRRINVRQQLAQEIRVIGVHYHLLPCNSTGAALQGAAAPIAWGDAQGLTAAIVVGVNLPIQLGAWSSAPAFIAGIDGVAAAPVAASRVTSIGTTRYITAPIRFPTGTFADVRCNVNTNSIDLAGEQYPVRSGENLDVALVMSRDYIHGVTGQVCGLAQVGLVLGHTINDRPFRQ